MLIYENTFANTRFINCNCSRHPERAIKIEAELVRRGHQCVRRSTGRKLEIGTKIYIADTLGELGLFYRLARIAFIGGSTGRNGGHNPLEAAQLDVPSRTDLTWKISSVADALMEHKGAVTVHGSQELAQIVGQMLENHEVRCERAEAAKKVVKENSDVIDRVCDAIRPAINTAIGNEIDADT